MIEEIGQLFRIKKNTKQWNSKQPSFNQADDNDPLRQNISEDQQLQLQSKQTKKQNKKTLMRGDVFLIKIKINQATFSNIYDEELSKQLTSKINKIQRIQESQTSDIKTLSNEIRSYISKKQFLGDFILKTTETEPFHLSLEQYQRIFPKQIKKDLLISAVISQKFQQISSNMFKNFQQAPFQSQKNVNQSSKKSSLNNNKKSPQTSKVLKKHILKMNKSVYESIMNQSINQNIKNTKIYEQKYQSVYKRPVKMMQNSILSALTGSMNIQLPEKSSIQNQSSFIHARPSLKILFGDNGSFMFSTTKNGILQLSFKQTNLTQVPQILQSKIKQKTKQTVIPTNLFWGKFSLKHFLQIPFTHHQVDLTLHHKTQNTPKQKYAISDSKIEVKVKLQIFCVPGNLSLWGTLHINQISLIWKHQLNTESKGRKYVRPKIQFPDVLELNKVTSRNEEAQINMKPLSLEQNEIPLWTQGIDIRISPQRNKLRIKFIQMQDNLKEQKSVIAEKTINLLEGGFLYDQVHTQKSIPLRVSFQGVENSKTHQIADLRIDFFFEMCKSNDQISQKYSNQGNNSFIDHSLNFI